MRHRARKTLAGTVAIEMARSDGMVVLTIAAAPTRKALGTGDIAASSHADTERTGPRSVTPGAHPLTQDKGGSDPLCSSTP